MNQEPTPAKVRLTDGLGPRRDAVLRELDDTTNQTWRGKRARWADLIRAQAAQIERLKRDMADLLPYAEMHGLRLSNDYRAATSDATRHEGNALLEKVDLLRRALEHAVNVLEDEGCTYTASQCREALGPNVVLSGARTGLDGA